MYIHLLLCQPKMRVNAVLSLKTLIILHTVDVVLNLFKTVFILLN